MKKTTSPRTKVPHEELLFGKTFTDHMLVINWTETGGWESPQIYPFGDLTISPASSCLHYGVEVSNSYQLFSLM